MAVVQQTVRGLLVLLMTLARTARSQEECPRNHDCKCEVMDQRRLRALEVDCSEQDLKRLPNMAVFRGMAIGHLNMEEMGLTSLPAGGFEGLLFRGTSPYSDPNIELSNNPLQVIANDAFKGVAAASVGLRITNCRLEDFPAQALSHLTNLTFLFIGNNRFTHIPAGAFRHFKKLRLISLNNNELTTVDPEVFAGLENVLEKVNLEATQLEEFPSAAVEKMTKLEMLRVSKNSITKLDSGALSNFKTKRRLEVYLMDNDISEISPEVFSGAKFQLKKLQLDGNSITSLSFLNDVICTKVFSKSPHVYLMDSPLKCDCETYALLRSERVLVDGTCRSPDDFKNLDIRPDFVQKAQKECKSVTPECSRASSLITDTVWVLVSLAATSTLCLFHI